MNLAELNNKTFHLDGGLSRQTSVKRLINGWEQPLGTPAIQFESDVLNYLLEHHQALGIAELYRLKNSLADGYALMADGTGICLEFKSILNWDKSNVARSQLLMFKIGQYFEKLDLPAPNSGIIIFGEFAADWAKTQGGRKHENGWYQFYWEQAFYNHFFNINLLQLKNGMMSNPGFSSLFK